MKVVIDHRGVVTYPYGNSTSLESPPARGMSPNSMNVVTPASASLYTLTTPGMYYFTGRVAATASVPEPSSVPGSLWIVALTAGSQSFELSGTTALGDVARCFYTGSYPGLVPVCSGNTLTLNPYSSVSFLSQGKSYVVLGVSGSITVA